MEGRDEKKKVYSISTMLVREKRPDLLTRRRETRVKYIIWKSTSSMLLK